MYNAIMVPVDLEHMDAQRKAMNVAARVAREFDASIHIVSVAGPRTGEDSLHEQAFSETLRGVATGLAEQHGISVTAHPVRTAEKRADLDVTLRMVAEDLGVNLIVMGSHEPGLRECLIASNAGHVASHSKLSVFVVR